MSLVKWSIKNSLLVNLISIFIILIGLFSMSKMRRDAFPLVDNDIVTVTTVYPGAPTEDVEKFVTIPLEKEIKALSGIDEMNSKSNEGLSSIGIYIDPGTYDKDKVVDDIQRAVNRVTNLPQEAEDPEILELDTRELPVIDISLSGDVNERVRRDYAELLKEEVLELEGVAQVIEFGWRDQEFWVEVDPAKLSTYHVSLQEVIDALRTRNVTLPGGQLTTTTEEFNVRTTGEFRTAEEIANVIIRANDTGHWLKVKDVARVKKTFEDETTIVKINGERASAMLVVKTEQADATKVVDRVQRVLETFRARLPEGMHVTVTNDSSYFIKRRFGVLQRNGIIGFFLVLIILFLFLDPIPAFMTALGIPVALFLSFWVMSMLDISINLVSVLGLILVLGMLVDDGIIVAENIYRHVEKGMPAKEAAILGTEEVMAPVTVTILTTFAAFGPLLFMENIIGKFIRAVPLVVLITLSASLFEAFIILPCHLADAIAFFKPKVSDHTEKKWFIRLKNFYIKILGFCLNKRYIILAFLAMTLVFSFWVAKTQMKLLLFTGEGMEYFMIRAEAKKGTPLENTEKLLEPVEQLISALPEEELDSYRTYIGAIEEERGFNPNTQLSFDPNAKHGSHLGQITVFLTPLQQRDRTPQEIAADLREKIKRVDGFEKIYTFIPKEGPPVGAAVKVDIKGEDYTVMQTMAQPFIEYLNQREGVSGVNTSYGFGKKQLKIIVDEEKAKKYLLTVERIAASIRNVFKGGVATTVKPEKAEEEIDVVVRFPKEARSKRDVFNQILIPNEDGNLVKLKSVAHIEEKEGVYLINHLDGKRVLYVTAQVDNKKATSLEVNRELQKRFKGLEKDYFGYSINYSGEFEDQQKSNKNLLTSYAFAIFMIFILLVAMFRSLIQPFIIMAVIPFGIIGVILAFWVHDMILPAGRPLSLFALMGMVGLTGIVVNDSVVLVDFINRLRKAGAKRASSLIEAGAMRLRPIIMTSATTIGGLVSMAYGIGGGDPFLKPMALAIVWGLVFSTVLTLIGLPCIYAVIDDFTENVLHKHMVRKD